MISWFTSKHKAKELKQEVTKELLNGNVEQVIDCVINAIQSVGLIRPAAVSIVSKVHGQNLVANKGGNYAALRVELVLVEIARAINSEIHRAYRIGATDEGQAVLVMIDDEIEDVLRKIVDNVDVIYSTIKKSDSHLKAKEAFEKGLNTTLRTALRVYFAEYPRLIQSVTHYKAVNYIESVNVTDDEVRNFLSRKSKKTDSAVFDDLFNPRPATSLLNPDSKQQIKS